MNRLCCLIVMLITSGVCNAQNMFQKAIYGMSLFQSITKPTSDGGYILTGCKYSNIGDEDVFLIKMDANGDTLWTRTYLYPGGNEQGEDVIQTIDGGFFVVAYRFLMKTDSLGQLLWTKQIYSSWGAFNISATECPNGDLLIGSHAHDPSIPTRRLILTKIDSSGNLLFMKSFGNFNNPRPNCIKITNDGGYIIAAETDYGSSSTDALLIKTDSLGNLMWAHQYGGNSYDLFRSVEQTATGDYIAIGIAGTITGNFLVKVDSAGTLIWARTYTAGNSSCAFGMITKTSDQNFVFCDDNATIAKMNSNGTIQWAKSYMPGIQSQSKRFNSIKEAFNGSLIASGSYIEVPWNGYLYIVKSDSTGNNPCFANNVSFSQNPFPSKDSSIICTVSTGSLNNISVTEECFCDTANFLCNNVGIFQVESTDYLTVFPNPFHNKIEVTNEGNQEAEIILFDISARKVMQHVFSRTVVLNTEQLSKGIYIYEVRNKNGAIKKGKLVKE